MEELIAKLAKKVWPGVDSTRLEEAIEDHPCTDSAGRKPSDPAWDPTYDLNAAASSLWGERASELSGLFDFTADGGSFSRNQAYENAIKQASFYKSRSRISVRSINV